METVENKIAKFLTDEGYYCWRVFKEAKENGLEPLRFGEKLVLEILAFSDTETLMCRFPLEQPFRPNTDEVKLINDYLFGLTGYPIFK